MAKADRSGGAFAKTTRPTIGSVVERQGLFARLDAPPGRTVVWISGPPGSGKTTLAASYVQARAMRSVWYQVDADDADPASFFHYLSHAVRKLDGTHARNLPSYTPQHGNDVASFARKFFRQLFAGSAEPLAIVLDNLHVVAADSALHTVFEAGFSQIAKGCVVIVTSRGEPPASLARLQASGQLCCVTGHELSVRPDEIVEIAALRGQVVAPAVAAKLYERTRGWAAGLVLMLEHSKFSGKVAELPGGATPQVIFDYLAGEIFDRFEPQARDFLLRIACLPRMSAAVAATLSGEAKAERLLINLARNDYFVRDVSADGTRIYQLHPLLREFLRNRAAQTMPEAMSGAWLQRAALLLQGAGQTEDAVALLIDAGDWPQVGRIALEEADVILAQGRSETLAGWLEFLPLKLMESDPRLLHASAVARAMASPRAARQLFERAFDGFRSTGDATGMVRSCCGIVDAIVFEFDDVAPLDRWLDTLDGLLAQAYQVAPGAIDLSAVTSLIRGTLVRDAGNGRVAGWLDRALRAVQDNASAQFADTVRAEFALARASAALARGDIATATASVDALRRSTVELPAGTRLALALGTSANHLVGGADAEARRVARDALTEAGSEGIHAADEWLRIIVAVSSLCAGDHGAARSELERLDADGSRLRRGDRACVHYIRSWIAALDGDAIGAHREARLALSVAIESGIPWFECLARIALAQREGGGVDRRGMHAQLRAAEALAERLASPWLRFCVQLGAGAAAREAGDRQGMQANVRAAFHLGREHGFGSPPGWHPQNLADLCVAALDANIEPDFARALVRIGKLAPTAPPLRVTRWPWPFRIESCGGFRCLRGETPIELSGKGPGRPMEMLKVLTALGRHNVRADQIADALWPHMDADYAYKSFTATLHRLRRLLDEEDALVLRDGRLTLNKGIIWIDTWALEQLFEAYDAAARGVDPREGETLRRKYTDEALAIYRGPFLPDEAEQPAYIACREQLRARMLRFVAHVARGWEGAGAPEVAADEYLRFIEVDEVCEPLYRQLMLCYERSGMSIDALTTYERLRTILSSRLKTMPSPETQALYARLKSVGPAAAAQ